ncbi:hypothetical protein Tsubulata_005426 [Turnera subulata]|uniref:Uncharacterized protein n=1 Tax=Turnera subulata TaxID=218843 RepID=A0A9Q0JHJ3_9ROSI|nr:hypothetical protein Tsubulata_005426 [Turnera subulata]
MQPPLPSVTNALTRFGQQPHPVVAAGSTVTKPGS